MPNPLVNRLVVDCNKGVVITPELQAEAAKLRAAVVCGIARPATLEVDYSSVLELREIAARTPTQLLPDGKVKRDDRELRAATQRIQGQFEVALFQSNVDEIIGNQLHKPVQTAVRGMRAPR